MLKDVSRCSIFHEIGSKDLDMICPDIHLLGRSDGFASLSLLFFNLYKIKFSFVSLGWLKFLGVFVARNLIQNRELSRFDYFKRNVL